MSSVFDTMLERGFLAQTTHYDEIRQLLDTKKITFYIGFDPTADSLHVGHFIQVMAMAHMQRAGHQPIALVGGGTTMVGDPSGRTDMRTMMTFEEIDANANKFKSQLSKFIDFSDDKAIMVNNADWLLKLNYVDFLRDIGTHFSVNRMLTADCYKSRLEKGLSFIEFNYMLMQSYDFLELFQRYGCTMQLGGDDQWSNIISGVDLVRRKTGKDVFGMTFNLLTTSAGVKMGKTQKGALWIDPDKTSPFEFYQYWRNIHDEDVIKCLKLLTFIPIEEINELQKLQGAELNQAKKLLAFEVTKLIHGEQYAKESADLAETLFEKGLSAENMPSSSISHEQAENGVGIADLLLICGLAPSKSEARRLVVQGGISINGEKVTDVNAIITTGNFRQNECIIQKGKKIHHKAILNI